MDFTWRDGDRTVRFGRGALAEAPDLLGEGYALLTTQRAAEGAPGVVAGAASVTYVRSGRVDEVAGELVGQVDGELLVALGGGRVVDVAKALAAEGSPRPRVAAIPTTLSAAEMTRVHRRAAGAAQAGGGVRPHVVLNDPELSASQPEDQLAASAANALGHAVEAPLTTLASPVPTLAAHDAVRRIALAAAGEELDRDELALASLLAGSAIDSAWYGLHHVLSQTVVRLADVGHGPANAALLPWSIRALRERAPDGVAQLDDAAGRPVERLAAELAERTTAPSLAALGVTDAQLDACAEAAAGRPELELIPPPVGRDELRAIYAAAL